MIDYFNRGIYSSNVFTPPDYEEELIPVPFNGRVSVKVKLRPDGSYDEAEAEEAFEEARRKIKTVLEDSDDIEADVDWGKFKDALYLNS